MTDLNSLAARTPIHHRHERFRGVRAKLQDIALAAMALLLGTTAYIAPARADSLVLAQTGLLIGSQSAQYSFDAPSSGTLTLNFSDFGWPTATKPLAVEIASPANILQTMSGAGQMQMALDAGTYYAYVIGQAVGTQDISVFSVMGSFQPLAPVPLPAGLTLLCAGMIATLWSLRRHHRAGPPAALVTQ